MNTIEYAPFTFDDTSIVSGSIASKNALMFDSLEPDELTVEVVSNDTGRRKLLTVEEEWYTTVDGRGYVVMTNDIRNFTYGDPVYYYFDGVLKGKYFIRSVERLSINHFRLSAYSVVGLWTSIQHFGGIYSGETAGEIIADLLQGFSYTISSDVASVPLYGYLPIASIRDNLRQVLFALGASLVKDSNGNPRFKFLENLTPVTLSDDRIFIGGKLNYKTPATDIRVIEHSYYISDYDIEVSLFDNTDGSGTAVNKLVTFDEPCHNLVADGLTIVSSGANHAYVTGTGTLTGKKYTHTTNIFTVPTGRSGETNIAEIKSATLVSAANSANVAARVAEYKGSAEEVSYGITLGTDDVKPATLVTFTDPYGDESTGIITTMNVTMSGKPKGDCVIVKGYTPAHFGNNFENVAVITSSQTWSIPAGKEIIRVVLGQGGQAGQNGYTGGTSIYPYWSWETELAPGSGGAGGAGGEGGKVFVTDIRNPSGSIVFSIGAGGTPGDGSGATGNEGGETTATYNGFTYTTVDGAIPPEGYRDVISGITYSVIGIEGLSGANGGAATEKPGENLTYGSETWYGGQPGQGVSGRSGYAHGGSGGGAAYGGNGEDGEDYHTHSSGYWYAGDGGKGGDAAQLPYTPRLGSGGIGGCGGGGAGQGGYANDDGHSGWHGDNGGGAFSLGGDGGSGYALIFY